MSRAMSVSVMATIALVTTMTVAAELSSGFKAILTSMTGHHWVAKSLVSLLFFAASSLVLPKFVKNKKPDAQVFSYCTAMFAVAGGAVILLFFVAHFLAR